MCAVGSSQETSVAAATPVGVGGNLKPPVWLKPGDRVVVTSSVIGELETTIGG